jgi:hypothetical protein
VKTASYITIHVCFQIKYWRILRHVDKNKLAYRVHALSLKTVVTNLKYLSHVDNKYILVQTCTYLEMLKKMDLNLKTLLIWRTFCNFFNFWYNFEALKYNLWTYKQWEFLPVILHSLNIAIIKLQNNST